MESRRSVSIASALGGPSPSCAGTAPGGVSARPSVPGPAAVRAAVRAAVGSTAMIAAASTVTTTVGTAAPAITAAMEATATAAVKTSATAASMTTTAVLGQRRDGQANECERSENREKTVEQGGFPHLNTLHRNGGWMPREGKLRLNSSYLYLEPHSKLEVVYSLSFVRKHEGNAQVDEQFGLTTDFSYVGHRRVQGARYLRGFSDSVISKTLGHSFPVTKRRFRIGS